MRWAFLLPGELRAEDPRIVAGEGRPDGLDLHTLAGEALGGAFQHPCGGVLLVDGPFDLRWTMHQVQGQAGTAAYWSVQPLDAASRLWWSPGGILGYGRSVERVEVVQRILRPTVASWRR